MYTSRATHLGAAQEYIAELGLPHTILITCMFFDNFIKTMRYKPLPDGSFEFSNNLGQEPHALNAVGAIGETAACAAPTPFSLRVWHAVCFPNRSHF
jgi:hypothetical protein